MIHRYIIELTDEVKGFEKEVEHLEMEYGIEEIETGHWIDNHTTCSLCGWQMIDDVLESPNMVFFPFCPNCGADMRQGSTDHG